MKGKKASESEVVLSQLMMPSDANHAGYVHGGNILKIADMAAYVCAAKHARTNCVTASVDRVDFERPVKIGELVTFSARLVHVGKSSLQVNICVDAEDINKGKKRHTNSCYITCVALDKQGKPTRVPPLIVETTEEKKLWKLAEKRRELFKKKSRK